MEPDLNDLGAALRARVAVAPLVPAFRFLATGEVDGPVESWTYADLDRRARAIAAVLQAAGLAGQRALLIYPAGLDFIAAFFGCAYAGVIAVPAYPPEPTRLSRTLPRLRAIVKDCAAQQVLTISPVLKVAPAIIADAPEFAGLDWMATDLVDPAGASAWTVPLLSPQSIAFLQYTSGSTGEPRGVMVRHRNVLHNLRLIARAMGGISPADRFVSWLPQYHDMGLMCVILLAACHGASATLMSPIDFLRSPLRWLRAISHLRATNSGGPNFAFDLCVRKSTKEERAELDLSSWKFAYNASEPIPAESVERFIAAFGPSGFNPAALAPCYGLAEVTAGGSFAAGAAIPRSLAVKAEALARGLIEVPEPADQVRRIVSCGTAPLPEHVIAIVDPVSLRPQPQRQIGEIWIKSPSVGAGYWQKPELSHAIFEASLANNDGPFLRTGDLGFLDEGHLYVTGRSKDVIILRGLNHYPQDIEGVIAASHPAISRGGCAAFSYQRAGEERLGVVAGVELRQGPVDLTELLAKVQGAVAQASGLRISGILLLSHNEVPKTSSGKIQRGECRRAFLSGTPEELLRWEENFSPDGQVAAESDLPTQPAQPDRAATEAAMEAWLLASLAASSGRDRVDPQRSPAEYGVDSLLAVQLAEGLASCFGRAVPWTMVSEAASIRALVISLAALPPTGPDSPAA